MLFNLQRTKEKNQTCYLLRMNLNFISTQDRIAVEANLWEYIKLRLKRNLKETHTKGKEVAEMYLLNKNRNSNSSLTIVKYLNQD